MSHPAPARYHGLAPDIADRVLPVHNRHLPGVRIAKLVFLKKQFPQLTSLLGITHFHNLNKFQTRQLVVLPRGCLVCNEAFTVGFRPADGVIKRLLYVSLVANRFVH